MFDGELPPVLIGGHTHLQMLRRFGQSVIVNPGSVGQPFSQWWPKEIRVAHWAEYGVIDSARRPRPDRPAARAVRRRGLLEAAARERHAALHWWIDSWNAC